MNIIHLSDIHFEVNDQGTLSYERDQFLKALIVDLKNYVDSDSIIVITGDLINKGGLNSNGLNIYEKLKELFLDKILENFPFLDKKIFIVPGNHDIQKDKIDKINYKGINATFNENYNEGNKFIVDNLNNFDKLAHIQQYKNFEKSFYENYTDINITNFYVTCNLEINKIKVGIACLNSAWLCSFSSKNYGNLILGKSQVGLALNNIKSAEFKIAIFHHPIDFFTEQDREYIEPLLFKNFDLILNGHSHKIDGGYYQTLKGNTFISISPATLEKRETDARFFSGYTIVKIDINNKYVVSYRKYLWDSNKFVSNTDIGNDKGEKEFLISKEKQEIESLINKMLSHISNSHVDEVNTDLIIYNAEDGLPNSLEEIFVYPTISNVTESQSQNEKIQEETKYYSLEEIMSSKENFLIYGKKESGKTILVDYFLLELNRNYKKYEKIPVLIKFQNIKNKDIETCIKQFLSLNTRQDFISLYNKGIKFVMLIDDLSFLDSDKHKLKKLIDFKKQYSNVQIIATSLHKIETIIPEDHLDYNEYFNFNTVYIHDLKTSQIKSLIRKWFKNKNIDFQENIEKLLKSFRDLGLPRTPLSLTMFLWIIHKQERRPINNAVLSEIFIENLLEKANFENVYSETFDFYNKKRLLAFISHYMLKEGDPNNSYAISYSKALDYVSKYLKGKTGNPKRILDNLIERGIFVIVNNLIKFKFAFYFHFFLAAYMEFEESFIEEVLKNVVEFKDELEYYTGLNRDKEKILDAVLTELRYIYQELNNLIFEESKKNIIDNVLETKSPLSNYLELDNIKNKPSDTELEKVYDENLQQLPVKRDIKSKELMNDKKIKYKLGEILELSAHLLKNLEEINFSKKVEAYDIILKSSISFLLLYRQYLLDNYKNLQNSSFLPKGVDFHIFINLLPLLHQVVLYDWMGTIKLKEIMDNKIKKELNNTNISEFEKFLSVFLYSDIKASGYIDKIKNLLKNVKSKYILDSIFFKILSYYFLRSKDRETDILHLNLLADIKIKLGQIDKSKKSQFINKLSKDKQQQLRRKNYEV